MLIPVISVIAVVVIGVLGTFVPPLLLGTAKVTTRETPVGKVLLSDPVIFPFPAPKLLVTAKLEVASVTVEKS